MMNKNKIKKINKLNGGKMGESQNVQKRERNLAINFLKFIAVIEIILIHDKLPGKIGIMIRGIAASAVPIFFMVSGYYSYLVSQKVIIRRAKRTFWYMLLANGIYFVWDITVEVLAGNSVQSWILEHCSFKKILVWLLMNESSLRGHLWFLGALLYAYLFWLLILKWKQHKNMTPNTKQLLTLSFILLLGNILGGEVLTQFGKNIQIPYIRNWLFCGIPFFILGYCIHKWQQEKEIYLYTLHWITALLIVIPFALLEIIVTGLNELYITTIFIAVTAFLLALSMENKVRNSIVVFLGNIADKYGLWIYILQIMVIKTIQSVEKEFVLENNFLLQWISPIITFVITWILAWIIVALLEKWKLKLRKAKEKGANLADI